jgi:hypothetical protein
MTGVQLVGLGMLGALAFLAMLVGVWGWGYTDGRRDCRRESERASAWQHTRLNERLSRGHGPHDWPPAGHPHGRV